eukprot:Hpha_TRINITY_DN15274_c1_g1::TRINITY_DN15274_c1_g1_i2::g.66916::m.66916
MERFISCSTGWIIRDSDDSDTIRIKRIFTPIVLVVLIVNAIILLVRLRNKGEEHLSAVSNLGFTLSSLWFLLKGLKGNISIDTLLGSWAVFVLVQDLAKAAGMQTRQWSLVVPVLDAALVFHRNSLCMWIMGMCAVYLAVERLEAATRFGLYEWVGGSAPVCECETPPCAQGIGVGVSSYGAYLWVLFTDFWITRRFASDNELQLRRVNASVQVAAEVAEALARYDVDVADRAISRGEHLPPELRESYFQLMHNLKSYRAYLPDSLLDADTDDEDETDGGSPQLGELPPPVSTDGEAELAIVFTDIQSSTVLWEAFPLEMQEALRTHNATLRMVARAHRGYEVKVVGDALMLAFDSAYNAATFGVVAQTSLVQSEWPPGLCEHPLCKRVEGPMGMPLWHGVRVRIGVNWGLVNAERNPLTGRYDFLGGTVNTASRVEGALKYGGLTGVTQAVVDKMGGFPPGVFTVPLGQTELRGLGQRVMVHVVLPKELMERWSILQPLMQSGAPATAAAAASEQARDRCLGFFPMESHRSVSVDAGSDHDIHFTAPRDDIPSARPMILPLPEDRRVRVSSLSSPGLPEGPVGSRLGLGLQVNVGSCAAVRGVFPDGTVSSVESAVTRFLVGVETAALRTQGHVVCVVSAMAMFGWNTATRCPEHLSQSAHFTSLLLEGAPTHAGLASGRVMSGNISGARRRYVTVAGGCVELSMSLSEAASLMNISFMAAGEMGERLGQVIPVTPLDPWSTDSSGDIPMWGPAGQKHEVSHSTSDRTERSPPMPSSRSMWTDPRRPSEMQQKRRAVLSFPVLL